MAKTAKAITTIQNGARSCRTRASHAALPPAWRCVAGQRTYNPLGSTLTFLSEKDVAEGVRGVRELAAVSDVVIENFLPGTLERLGLLTGD